MKVTITPPKIFFCEKNKQIYTLILELKGEWVNLVVPEAPKTKLPVRELSWVREGDWEICVPIHECI